MWRSARARARAFRCRTAASRVPIGLAWQGRRDARPSVSVRARMRRYGRRSSWRVFTRRRAHGSSSSGEQSWRFYVKREEKVVPLLHLCPSLSLSFFSTLSLSLNLFLSSRIFANPPKAFCATARAVTCFRSILAAVREVDEHQQVRGGEVRFRVASDAEDQYCRERLPPLPVATRRFLAGTTIIVAQQSQFGRMEECLTDRSLDAVKRSVFWLSEHSFRSDVIACLTIRRGCTSPVTRYREERHTLGMTAINIPLWDRAIVVQLRGPRRRAYRDYRVSWLRDVAEQHERFAASQLRRKFHETRALSSDKDITCAETTFSKFNLPRDFGARHSLLCDAK